MNINKLLVLILIIAVLVTFAFVFYLFFNKVSKSIVVLSPAGGEEIKAGDTYRITWQAKGVGKVGVILYKDQEPQWIAKDIDGSLGEYEWNIYPGQTYGSNFWIAVAEFPWTGSGAVGYTEGAFSILYPQSAGCDAVSIEKQWPYTPLDFPGVRKAFITESLYSGNLGGLEGADKKCQDEAKKQGFSGIWHAFLGGDSDKETIIERFKKMPKKTEGIFVEAKSNTRLPSGVTCHALLGKNFDEFTNNLKSLQAVNNKKSSISFFSNLSSVWLGRLDQNSKNSCLDISSSSEEAYSSTSTCQRWTKGQEFVSGYSQDSNGFPKCYSNSGQMVSAVALAGLSVSLEENETDQAKNYYNPNKAVSCQSQQKLICVEE